MKVLVTGAGPSGFLGAHVKETFSDLDAIFVGSRDFDLTDPFETKRMMHRHKPSVIVHMAAVCGGILANKNSPATFLEKNTAMNLNVYNAVRDFNQFSLNDERVERGAPLRGGTT